MEQLSPLPTQSFLCPVCAGPMEVEGAWLPGMYAFARTRCDVCQRRFLSHMRIHFGMHCDLHRDAETLAVVKAEGDWFSQVFRNGGVIERDPVLRIDVRRELRKPVVVNLVDFLYGHCFHRLYMTAQLLDASPPYDILLIAPQFMEWLIPDGVAEVWTVDISTTEAKALFPALARRLDERLRNLPPCPIANMWGPGKVEMSRFSRVQPVSHRTPGVFETPRLTFSWRGDRFWTYRGRELPHELAVQEQAALLGDLCHALRDKLPGLDVAVTGYGTIGRLPDWVTDMRTDTRTEALERAWVERYAMSQATMGVYGSNMLLPMAHSAGCVQLATPEYIHVLNHAIEFVDHRFSASSALGRVFSIPTSSSLSDIATVTCSAIMRATRAMSHAAGDVKMADWVMQSFPVFRLTDAEGGVL